MQGLICLGEHSFEELSEEMTKNSALKRFKPVRVDVQSEE